jgi:hypothetical protein
MIKYVILGFLFLEISSVLTLYFFPGSKLANGMGVFKAWEKSKGDKEIHDLVKYLVNWVAGTKLIFIGLLILILLTAEDQILLYTSAVLAGTISVFYWRLFPLIRNIDRDGQLDPKNYSVLLGIMILVFVISFIIMFLLSM